MFESIISWIVETVGSLGYFGITIMMFLESSFFPFPSEVVMIPAGYLAHEGDLSLTLSLFFGVLGSILGALLNYYIAFYLGKPFLLKFGKYLRITPVFLDKLNNFFEKHGAISTFIGRLLPGVRQYISFPAGLAKMNLLKFTIFTGVGAGFWCAILLAIGYFLGKNEELIKKYSTFILIAVFIFSIIVIFFYVIYKRREKIKV